MNTRDVYTNYKINTGLQEHMLRVAGVAHVICQDLQLPVNTNAVIQACLLHDMGNILKFKFDVAPELYEPEGVAYWQAVQTEVRAKYGSDVYAATDAMVTEVASAEVASIVNESSFDVLETVAASGSLEAKILEYADMRVGLHGVISLEARFRDIAERYVPQRFTQTHVDTLYQSAQTIETYLFSHTTRTPDAITDEVVEPLFAELYDFEI